MTKKQFLQSHYRYNTMNSWNDSTSYAANVKVRNFVPDDLLDNAYSLLDSEEVFADINYLLDDFARRYDYQYQIGFNGRSNGYLVLYRGERKLSEYKSVCQSCGQKSFKTIEESGDNICGNCGQAARINQNLYSINTFPGQSIDQGEDFEDWSKDDIDERVKLVKDFDATVEEAKRIFIDYCKNYTLVDEEVPTTKTIKVLKAK